MAFICTLMDEEVQQKMRDIMSVELRAAARCEGVRIEKETADRIVERLERDRMWTR